MGHENGGWMNSDQREAMEDAAKAQESSQPLCELCGEPMPVGETMFKFHGYSGPCPKPPLPKAPHSDLGKLLQAIVQSIGATDPRAFVEVDISKAITQADATRPF